jgi:FkbM family methyltransferase
MKNSIRKLLGSLGYEIRKLDPFPVGSYNRPVGDMKKLLEDLKFRGLKCKSIFDIGAHIGSWSTLAKEVFTDAAFCLIEPQVELKPYLKDFCNANTSVYHIAAAGAKSGKDTLSLGDDPSGSTFFPGEGELLKPAGKQRIVDIITVDEIIESGSSPVPELMKLDVQGYELEALKGCNTLFGKTEAFILEVSFFSFGNNMEIPGFSDVVSFMLERGYVVYDFPGFLRRPYDGALGQCDICFVKKDGFLRASNNWI